MHIDGIKKTDYRDPIKEKEEILPGISFQDIMDELEKRGLNVSRTEKDLGIRITHQIYHTNWREYLKKKYPIRFGNAVHNPRSKKSRAKAKIKKKEKEEFLDNFLATANIECMEDGCHRKVKVHYEASKGLPKGFKKRCAICKTVAAGKNAGNFEEYRQQIRR
jgi:hypothetical protein